jgi:hypothetical protein
MTLNSHLFLFPISSIVGTKWTFSPVHSFVWFLLIDQGCESELWSSSKIQTNRFCWASKMMAFDQTGVKATLWHLIETTQGFIFGGFTPISLAVQQSRYISRTIHRRVSVFTVEKSTECRFSEMSQISKPSDWIGCDSNYGPVVGDNNDINVREQFQ